MDDNKKHVTKYLALFGLLLFIVQPLQAAEWGNLSGQFLYSNKNFKPKIIKVTKDWNICCKLKDHIVDESLVIGKNGGIKNIFIYLRNAKLTEAQIHTSYKKLPETVYIQHKDCILEPHALGL